MTLSNQSLRQTAINPLRPPKGDAYSKIAKIHKYWSRKPWSVVDSLIQQNSAQGSVILDPFCGSGVIGLQAVRAGRSFLGSDLNPFAVELTKETLDLDLDLEEFAEILQSLRAECAPKIEALYRIGGLRILYFLPSKFESTEPNVVAQPINSRKSEKRRIDPGLLPKVRLTQEDLKWIPDDSFPKAFFKDRFSYKGISLVSEMFSERNLKALAILNRAIEQVRPRYRRAFKLCLTNTLLHVSRLKSEQVRPLGVNNYWIPDDFIEENVWWRFENRCAEFIQGKSVAVSGVAKASRGASRVKVGDASRLTWIESDSVDYVLTDPPYGDAIQYSELSFIWNTWLNKRYQSAKEIIVNPCQKKSEDTYLKMLELSIKECHRVLKRSARATYSFHSRDIYLWSQFAWLLRSNGFELLNLQSAHGVGSPFTKNWARFSPKSDIYVTIEKTTSPETTREPLVITLSDVADQVKGVGIDNMTVAEIYDLAVLVAIRAAFNGHALSGSSRSNSIPHVLSLICAE